MISSAGDVLALDQGSSEFPYLPSYATFSPGIGFCRDGAANPRSHGVISVMAGTGPPADTDTERKNGAAAALRAAAKLGSTVGAVVSRGGRPDLTGPAIREVRSPTLLIVGSLDTEVLELNRRAYAELRTDKELAIVPNATHLFEEPGALEIVTRLASDWLLRHLGGQ